MQVLQAEYRAQEGLTLVVPERPLDRFTFDNLEDYGRIKLSEVPGEEIVIGAVAMWLLTLVLPPEIPVAVLPARGVQIAVGLVVMSALGAAVSLRRVVRADPASAIG